MDIQNVISSVAIVVLGAVALWHMNGRFDSIEHRMERGEDRLASAIKELADRTDARFAQVDQRFAQVDHRFAQVEDRFGRLEEAVGLVRSDLLRVAMAVGATDRPQAG